MCDMTALEVKVLGLFTNGCELTESELKGRLDGDTEQRWLRSILVKLYMKKMLCRTKRYNREKHFAEWIYTLPGSYSFSRPSSFRKSVIQIGAFLWIF